MIVLTLNRKREAILQQKQATKLGASASVQVQQSSVHDEGVQSVERTVQTRSVVDLFSSTEKSASGLKRTRETTQHVTPSDVTPSSTDPNINPKM